LYGRRGTFDGGEKKKRELERLEREKKNIEDEFVLIK
jgi:hypothetical protein